MSGVSFNEVPANLRVPGAYIEIDNSLANNASNIQEALFIGDLGTGGDTAINTLTRTTLPDDAKTHFGSDSPIYEMVNSFYDQNKITPMSAIALDKTTPDIAAALAAIGDKQFHFIICQYTDDAALNEIDTFLADRFSALKQTPGVAYIAKKDTNANLVTFGTAKNSPFISAMSINSIVDVSGNAVADYVVAAAYAGQASASLSIDPARPLQTLKLSGLYSDSSSEWILTERNLLLFSGMTTYRTNPAKEVFIERAITMYQTNAAGVADDSYLDIETVYTAIYVRERQRSRILSKFPRYKLAKDGTKFAPGQKVVTPLVIKGELLSLYKEMEFSAIVQDFDNYKATMYVEIDPDDPTRVNLVDEPMFVNGFMIYAGQIRFRKN
ncbi:MAG: phage tail protein [Thiomicrospira sp.]|nr:MAG: phage tail protein [Thiomicrospira sp.]